MPSVTDRKLCVITPTRGGSIGGLRGQFGQCYRAGLSNNGCQSRTGEAGLCRDKALAGRRGPSCRSAIPVSGASDRASCQRRFRSRFLSAALLVRRASCQATLLITTVRAGAAVSVRRHFRPGNALCRRRFRPSLPAEQRFRSVNDVGRQRSSRLPLPPGGGSTIVGCRLVGTGPANVDPLWTRFPGTRRASPSRAAGLGPRPERATRLRLPRPA
ncbi:hypothetical protein SAMN05421630_107408 [Prauserella marina]|uniref:Uncharacterized protein n=1 Tax=Prauserella marina TaxID=530584 RepID=A0A1G6U1J7_9PSEU|nr:hypothetical protein DES30_10632 [Prauserella marina]SDD35064.1 hypothetical protein SAMN05421630_107408 [Prauserella marina]